jgi:flagellar biosynthesis/type III secretory pathway protein FliH
MSPKVLKRSKMLAGTVRFEQKNGPRDPKRTEEMRAERESLLAEARRELAAETEAALKIEKEKLAALFQAELDRFYTRSEPELARLVLSIAARVCRQELALNREGVLQWVREGLSVLGDDGLRTVRVHHDDVAAVRALTETVGAGVRIQGDSSLAPGDVMIDGEREQFDARVSTRLEEVDRAFHRIADENT